MTNFKAVGLQVGSVGTASHETFINHEGSDPAHLTSSVEDNVVIGKNSKWWRLG